MCGSHATFGRTRFNSICCFICFIPCLYTRSKDAEPDLYEISRRYTLDPAPVIANNPPVADTEADSNERASSPILAIPKMPRLALPALHHLMSYNPPHPQPLLHLNVDVKRGNILSYAQYPSSMLTPTMSTESSNHVQPGHFPPHSSTQPMGNQQHVPGYYDPS
jgi:hypothetical protein